MTAYYNEIEPYAAQWLRNLIQAEHIAAGEVDERSIEDVHPDDIRGFAQCHFFAGIGIWSHALRSAGWADDRPVWTGSCPCQPFSAAGQGAGFSDERHLWPAWHHLIKECRPAVVFGEQVASSDAMPWLDLVQDDMEAMGYAFGSVPFPAASVGAPHIRDRLYFVANAVQPGRPQRRTGSGFGQASGSGFVGLVADCGGAGLEVIGQQPARQEFEAVERGGETCELANADGRHAGAERQQRSREHGQQPEDGGTVRGFWAGADWLSCRDGKARPVEPGTFPLAHGIAGRVGRLRAYGNGICAPQARVFIEEAMRCMP